MLFHIFKIFFLKVSCHHIYYAYLFLSFSFTLNSLGTPRHQISIFLIHSFLFYYLPYFYFFLNFLCLRLFSFNMILVIFHTYKNVRLFWWFLFMSFLLCLKFVKFSFLYWTFSQFFTIDARIPFFLIIRLIWCLKKSCTSPIIFMLLYMIFRFW